MTSKTHVFPPIFLKVQGFRSIDEQVLEIAPITLLYGESGAGKSSLLYAFMVLRNLLLNPNQSPSAFFNLGFVNLGDLRSVLHRRNPETTLGISIRVIQDWEERGNDFVAVFHEQGIFLKEPNSLFLEYALSESTLPREAPPPFLKTKLETTLPYPGNSSALVKMEFKSHEVNLRWNGLVWSLEGASPPEIAGEVPNLLTDLNAPFEFLRRTAMAPLVRGFTKPYYQPTSFSGLPLREDEVATALAQNETLEMKLSLYLEEIAGYQLRVRGQVGTSVFGLWVVDRESRVPHELVNAGFGLNQTAYLLALALYPETETLLVEEPEVHLHPSLVRRLAQSLARIAKEEGRRFVFSTHSESLVTAFLSMVAQGQLDPSDLACYLVEKRKGVTQAKRQKVSKEGQVEDGLISFMEGELEDLRSLLRIAEESSTGE